ncbi:MAG: RagB/SusD family nutrient uptake outer membrane protein [Parapedobacter sp.]|nr:MAG: RagB/SusD family nutrient uptake outer membrane protein [Parapedobacter sp.]
MKRIITIIGLVVLASCSNDFINLSPHDTVTINQLYHTDSDFQDAITGCYAPLRDRYGWMYIFGDLRGDDAWREVIRGLPAVRSNDFTMDASESLLAETWSGYYQIISRTNAVLANMEQVDTSLLPNWERYVGEARFLRALAYFDLVRIFGDVPMITSPLTIDEAYATRREQVGKIYDEVIIPDLIDAGNKLPTTYSGADVGRATKGAAKALLGKVYLTRNDFEHAETVLTEVTTLGYALLANYDDLWDYTNEHHSEYIFDVEYISGGVGQGSRITYTFLPLSTEFAALNGIAGGSGGEDLNPTQDLVDLFDTSPGDLRRAVTVDASGGFINGAGQFVRFIQAATYTKKYLTSTGSQNDSPANWKVIRYADVLLMLAEALNENGKTEEALIHLNRVRVRAGVPSYSNTEQADLREKIYDERRLELAFEGHRWFDLLRTGRALEVLQSQGMQPHNHVFPIPLSQLQIINNNEILWQNQGY